jgi:hypothetical protein
MPKSKPVQPVDIKPVPPAATQVFETVAPPFVAPAPSEPTVVDEDNDKPGPDKRKVR